MQGKTVAILESRSGAQLAELVRRRGGTPVLAPALSEEPDMDREFIAAFVDGLESKPAVAAIFQTGVGTRALFEATDGLGLTEKLLALLVEMKVVVRGPKPTAALRSRSVRIDLCAADPFTTVEVLAALREVPIEGGRVVVQRDGATNEKLEEALHARNAEAVAGREFERDARRIGGAGLFGDAARTGRPRQRRAESAEDGTSGSRAG